jgi:prefoldin subunit 5
MAKDHVDEDIEELKQVLDSLRRLAERLQNELDEVRKDRDAWRGRAAEPAGWLRRLAG